MNDLTSSCKISTECHIGFSSFYNYQEKCFKHLNIEILEQTLGYLRHFRRVPRNNKHLLIFTLRT